MTPTVSAESIEKTYPTRGGGLAVLNGVSLTLMPDKPVVIMGPSGSGKSTLLNIIGTLDQPTAGTTTIDGVNPFDLPPTELAAFRNQRIGFVFQEHHLLPQCTALENVMLPTLSPACQASHPEQYAHTLLENVGLADRADHFPSELSGGERQRVAIARALVNKPSLLLADEPTGNLDRATAERIADLLFELQVSKETALLVVTHAIALANRFATQLSMVDGQLVTA